MVREVTATVGICGCEESVSLALGVGTRKPVYITRETTKNYDDLARQLAKLSGPHPGPTIG